MHFIWNTYTYPTSKYICLGKAADCSLHSVASATNYFVCDHCCKRQWFDSKIISFKSNDTARAEAQQRLSISEPLKLHADVRKQHAEFCKRGGCIARITRAEELPKILWNENKTVIRGLQWPVKPMN